MEFELIFEKVAGNCFNFRRDQRWNISAHPLVCTLDMYVGLGKAVYSINVPSLGANLADREEIILIIDGKTISLTAVGPSKMYQSGDRKTELAAFFLDQETFEGLRYCGALEIPYDQYVIPIPREGLGVIWNFLKD